MSSGAAFRSSPGPRHGARTGRVSAAPRHEPRAGGPGRSRRGGHASSKHTRRSGSLEPDRLVVLAPSVRGRWGRGMRSGGGGTGAGRALLLARPSFFLGASCGCPKAKTNQSSSIPRTFVRSRDVCRPLSTAARQQASLLSARAPGDDRRASDARGPQRCRRKECPGRRGTGRPRFRGEVSPSPARGGSPRRGGGGRRSTW